MSTARRSATACWRRASAILSQRVRYVTYDVTDYLRDGTNAVVLWCAAGWADFAEFNVKDKPLVMAQIEIQQPDGQSVQIVTDATWKTHPSPLSPIGNWAVPGYGGESYDAGREVPGWNDGGIGRLGVGAAAVFTPKVRLSAEMIEPNRRIETLEAGRDRSRTAPGVFRVDMGRNYAGWFEIHMKGRPGQKVTLQFAERPEREQDLWAGKRVRLRQCSGEGVFCQRFNHAASRWITIRGLETAPRAGGHSRIPCQHRFAPGRPVRVFQRLLNRIYETTLWTYRSLSLGGYMVDCPHRERMGYGGDAHATMETAMMNFAVGAFYTKWLERLARRAAAQRRFALHGPDLFRRRRTGVERHLRHPALAGLSALRRSPHLGTVLSDHAAMDRLSQHEGEGPSTPTLGRDLGLLGRLGAAGQRARTRASAWTTARRCCSTTATISTT